MSRSDIAQQWRQHIESWQDTNLKQAEYCRQHRLNPGQFSYWKHKLNLQLAKTCPSVTSGFAVAQFETTTHYEAPPELSLSLPDGISLSGIHAGNLHLVTQLLEVLR